MWKLTLLFFSNLLYGFMFTVSSKRLTQHVLALLKYFSRNQMYVQSCVRPTFSDGLNWIWRHSPWETFLTQSYFAWANLAKKILIRLLTPNKISDVFEPKVFNKPTSPSTPNLISWSKKKCRLFKIKIHVFIAKKLFSRFIKPPN